MTSPGFKYWIEKVVIGPVAEIFGWAICDEAPISELDIVIDDNHRDPNNRVILGRERKDVSLALGLPKAACCGFRAIGTLPPNATSISLFLGSQDKQIMVPLAVQENQSFRSWQVVCDSATEAVEYPFLTEQGSRYASIMPEEFASVRKALGLFRATPSEHQTCHLAPVSIIVPVYGGKSFLYSLFRALLENTDKHHPIILVDDGNPDRSISAFLSALVTNYDHITLIRKPNNEGYLKAVISGFELATSRNPNGHVVLLNSDVEVGPGWLERLIAPMEREPQIGSVTPLTNAGTICGFPSMPMDNPPFLGASVDDIDAVFATLDGVPPVEIPTGIGYCMAFNRKALQEIGFFDPIFGRGYGEEVDWCRRAMKYGFTNVAVPNLYVYHKHGGSFTSEEKQSQLEITGSIIQERYPDFDAEVQDFIRADPLRNIRGAAAIKIMGRNGLPKAVVIFDHGASGGAVTFCQKEVERLHAAGRGVIMVRPASSLRPGKPKFAIDIEILLRDNSFHFVANDLADLEAIIAEISVSEIVINSLVGHDDPVEIMGFIRKVRADYNVKLRVMHHDYFSICPSLNLIDANDRFCNVPSLEYCKSCAQHNQYLRLPKKFDQVKNKLDLAEYRRHWQDLFSISDRHVFFSKSSFAVMQRAFGFNEKNVRIISHFVDHVTVSPIQRPAMGARMSVAIIGGINVAKGSKIVEAMVELVENYSLPIFFELFGNIDRSIQSDHLHANGPYEPAQLATLIEERKCHAIFLPSIWPETYCYVLDEVIGLGLPVGAFDIGAPAERLRLWPHGFTASPITPEAALHALFQVLGSTEPSRGNPTPV